MATNFPGSQDSFTNPTSSDNLDSPDHAAQHANVNDAVEAIELALLDGAPLHIDDTNERVGIGTNSPATLLHVSNTGSEKIRIQDSDATGTSSYISFWDATERVGYIGYPGNDDIYLNNQAASGKILFRTNNTTRMTIEANGTVKIGSNEVWDRGDLRGSATTISVNSTGYGSISHGLGQTPDFAFVGARATLSSDGDNQLAFPITSYSSSTITFRAYEINGNGNSNYSSSTIYNASVYVFWMAGFFS
jgi:hypothetical protein|tara:strand:- start:513 stop:1256 length:744 start_codon:yes stop_codon:yes gene_type:complete